MRLALYKSTRPGLQGIYSRLARWIDGGPYSHCELVFSDGLSASASFIDGGVRFKAIDYDPAHWDFIELPFYLEPDARQWFAANEWAGYDLIGNLKFVMPLIPHSKSRWFCSEAIAEALGMADSWRYGPNGLAAAIQWQLKTTPTPA